MQRIKATTAPDPGSSRGERTMAAAIRAALVALTLAALTLTSGPSRAATDPAHVCDAAAQRAARASGVPLSVLRAITRTETGRARGGQLQPWPWTVNMEGAGKWFDSEEAAYAYVTRHFDRGARSFDVGCFQINYRWHGQHFASVRAMFDPQQNAAYAARFLARLHAETGDWSKAAGAYHSRTPRYAERYTRRFDRIRKSVGGPAPSTTAAARPAAPRKPAGQRRNSYPLLQTSSTAGRFGSLVPLGTGGRALVDFDAAGS